MPSTAPNFENKEQRDFIMAGLFRAIKIQDEQVQTDAIQALAEVPTIAYGHIMELIPQVGECTVTFLAQGHPQPIREMLKFWSNLCQVEGEYARKNQSLNIVSQFKQSVLRITFDALNITEHEDTDDTIEETQDDISWTVSRAAGMLLSEVAFLLGDQIVTETI